MVFVSRLLNRMITLFENKAHVEHYAHHRPTWPTEVSQTVIKYATSLISKNPGNCAAEVQKFNLIDVGCGSGQSTPMYAPFCERVLGLDPSAEQINHAIKSNTFENIQYSVGTGEKIPSPDESVNIVCCAQSAHWLDYDAFFRECKRVLKPEGCLAVYGYTMAEISVSGEQRQGYCNDLFQSFFKRCDFHPRRAHVDNRMIEFFDKIPSANKMRNDSMHIRRDWNLTELEGYIQSWSGYRKLLANGEGSTLLQALSSEILSACGVEDPKLCNINVDWSVFMILSDRPKPNK